MEDDARIRQMLSDLCEGKEINWHYLRPAIESGRISREDARLALKGCLTSLIPRYRSMSEVKDTAHWKRMMEEAEEALAALENGGLVQYRGIKLFS